MKRSLLIALSIALLSTTAVEARLFGGRFRCRRCRPVSACQVQAPVAVQAPSVGEPRYEYRCDGRTCRRVRID